VFLCAHGDILVTDIILCKKIMLKAISVQNYFSWDNCCSKVESVMNRRLIWTTVHFLDWE